MKLAIIVLLFPVFLLLGQAVHAQETLNPLAAFDNPNIVPGQIIVTFDDTVTEEMAQIILANHGFSIEMSHQCTDQGAGGPGEPTQSNAACAMISSWNESLHTVIAVVPEGQEKQSAQILLEEEQVKYVEPNYYVTVGEEDGTPDQPTPGDQPQTPSPPTPTSSNNGSFSIWNFSPILIAAGIIFLLIFGYAGFKKMKIMRP